MLQKVLVLLPRPFNCSGYNRAREHASAKAALHWPSGEYPVRWTQNRPDAN